MNNKTRVVLKGSARQVRPGAKVLGTAGPDEWIEVTLKLRRMQPLPELSGRPGQRISREELESKYGAAPADVEKVRSVLTALGLTVIEEDPGSASMKAGGPADIVEDTFAIKLLHYTHDGEHYRGRRGNLHVPAELDGIITGVFGLDTRRIVKKRPPRKRSKSVELARRKAAARSWFFPAELAAIYNFPAGDGSGQTVGLLEFGGGYFEDDLAGFCQTANVPMPTVKTVSVNNSPTDERDGAEGEVMLDVEVVGGVCPAATIVVYFSTYDENGWISALDAAVHDKDNPLSIISVSWGYAEDAQGAW
jgi:kumamolisin